MEAEYQAGETAGTQAWVAQRFEQIWSRLHFLRQSGQKEYAGGDRAFGNFERLATALQLSREKILIVYATKHWDGIMAWLNGHKSQREDVRGRIRDVIVYLMLLHAMVDEAEGPEA